MENNCAICLSSLEDNDNLFTLDCTHKFHTKCIMDWFRSTAGNGNCPLCNDNPFNTNTNDIGVPFFNYTNYIDNRFKTIKKYSRKKNAPESLKKEIIKYNDFNKKLIEVNKNMKEFEKNPEYKKMQQVSKKNRQDNWKHLRKVKNQKEKVVAMYPTVFIS